MAAGHCVHRPRRERSRVRMPRAGLRKPRHNHGFAKIKSRIGFLALGSSIRRSDATGASRALAPMRASSNWLEKFSLQINYGEGTVSSSSDIGTTPGIVPGEASNSLADGRHGRLHVESHFLISAHYGDRHGVASSDVKRGVKYVLWVAYL